MIGGAFTDHETHLFRVTRATTLASTTDEARGHVFAVARGSVDVQALDGVVRLEGRFVKPDATIGVGERFTSTESIARVLQFEGAER